MSNEPAIVTTKAGEPVTRVSDRTTGHHYTIPAEAYDPARHRPIKSAALDSYGEPAAPKFRAVPSKGSSAGEDGAGEPSSSPGDDDTPPDATDAQEGAQGAEGDPGVYDDTDSSSTDQEDQ